MRTFLKHFKYPIMMVFLTLGHYFIFDFVADEFGIFFQMAYFTILFGCLGLQGYEVHRTFKEINLKNEKAKKELEKICAEHAVWMKEEIRKMQLSESRRQTSLKRLN